MNHSYSTVKQRLLKLGIKDEEIFTYNGLEMEHDLESLFQLFMNILGESSHLNSSRTLFFFNSNLSINAKATKFNENYIATINIGLIQHLYKMFKKQDNLVVDSGMIEYIKFENTLGHKLNIMMNEIACQFTFYHEYAHLIQSATKPSLELDEELELSAKTVNERHLKEIDADTYASLSIASLLLQNFEKQSKKSEDIYRKFIVVTVGTLLLYFLSFPSYQKAFYLKEHSHPHPLVRIVNIVLTLIKYSDDTLNNLGHNFSLNPVTIINNALQFALELEPKTTGTGIIASFIETAKDNYQSISEYIIELQKTIDSDLSYATYQWNNSK